MSRPDPRYAVAAALTEGVRWLLAAIGTAMGAPAPACTCRADALARAAAICTEGRREWDFADAVLLNGAWMCVLQAGDIVYVVDVSVHSGAAQLLTQVRKAADGGLVAIPQSSGGGGRELVSFCAPRLWRGGYRCRSARGIGAGGRMGPAARAVSGHPRCAAPPPRGPGSPR